MPIIRAPRPRSRHTGPALLISGTLLLTGLIGSGATLLPAQAKTLKAITALPSHRSELRQETAAQTSRLGTLAATDTASNLVPSDGMGNPSTKTVVKHDQVLFTKTKDTQSGNATTRQAVAVNDDMTGSTSFTGDVAEATRSTIDHQWPSESGRFVNGPTESVLDFRKTVMGTDALYTLSSPNAVAEQWGYNADLTGVPMYGGTYVIKTDGGRALTNASAQSNRPAGQPALSTPVQAASGATPPLDQQWTVVDSGAGDHSSWLINKADGLCLQASSLVTGQAGIITGVCTSAQTSRWQLSHLAGSLVGIVTVTGSGTLTGDGPALAIGPMTAPGFEFHQVGEPGGSVPTWSVGRQGGFSPGHIAAPFTMATGDLDQVAGADGYFHDEAFVAYTDSNDKWAIRVVDYNANDSRLLVTSTQDLSFGKNGATQNGTWHPGDLISQIGDFDGDGSNEIAVAFQDANGEFDFYFFRYAAGADGHRSLKLIQTDDCVVCGVKPFADLSPSPRAAWPTLAQGYADSAVGDFNGDGRDDIALGWATTVDAWSDEQPVVNLGVWTLNGDFTTRSVEFTQPIMASGDLPFPMAGDDARASSGIQLEAGNLHIDPANGYGLQRSSIGIGWVAYTTSAAGGDFEPGQWEAYNLTPQFQIYGATDDCNDAKTSCTTTLSSLLSNPDPQLLFPQHPTTKAIQKRSQAHPDAPPLTFAAGAMGGLNPTDPPVDGIIAGVQQTDTTGISVPDLQFTHHLITSVVVPWIADDTEPSHWQVNNFSYEPATASEQHRMTPYDRAGDSLVLGAPVVLNVDQQVSEDLLAAEPPKHVDWLDGKFQNISANSDFTLLTSTTTAETFKSDTKAENSWSNGVSQGSDASTTFTAGIGPIEKESLKAEVNQKFEKSWSGTTTTSSSNDTELSTSVAATTTGDDVVAVSTTDYTIYRYPVLGRAGESPATSKCASDCRVFYEVTIPHGLALVPSGAGRSIDGYSPSWQNSNVLSYPALVGGKVPLPDLGSYSYIANDGSTVAVPHELFNASSTVSANTESVDLDFSKMAGSGSSRTSSRKWDTKSEFNLSAKMSAQLPLFGGVGGDVAVSSGFDASKDTMTETTGSITSSSDQKFKLEVPQINATRSYNVGTAYYYSTAGKPKVVHGVDLLAAPDGRSWWLQNYKSASDPALNLPGRINLGWNSGTKTYDDPHWVTGADRQLLRGFTVLQGAQTGDFTSRDVPYSGSPVQGDSVVFQVQVSNYSLKDMPAPTTADFYVVPTDDDGLKVIGNPVHLGQVAVPALGAQQSTMVKSPTWIAADQIRDGLHVAAPFRVFVQLNKDGHQEDKNPLKGTPCPPDSLDPDDVPTATALTDAMSTNATAPDPVGCGSNNQGFGKVTVIPANGSAAAAVGGKPRAAKVILDGGGLVTGNSAHLKLTEKSDIPEVPLGAHLTGFVRAASTHHASTGALVAVFDGKPADGKLVALSRLGGVDAATGGRADFSWTPDTPGLHELHQVLLGTSMTGEDDEQIMRVNVAPARDQYSVTAKASGSPVKPGSAYTIAGVVTPVPGTAEERRVDLQRKVADTWTTVDSQQTSSKGAYAFALTAPSKPGTGVYRVRKSATSGRHLAVSSPITVRYSDRFVVTAKLSTTTVKRGKSAAITGRVSPPMAVGSRTVKLQRHNASGWKTVATRNTTATGAYRFTVKANKAGRYRYRVAKTSTAGWLTGKSASVVLKVTKR